jgi:hypothetical protein
VCQPHPSLPPSKYGPEPQVRWPRIARIVAVEPLPIVTVTFDDRTVTFDGRTQPLDLHLGGFKDGNDYLPISFTWRQQLAKFVSSRIP